MITENTTLGLERIGLRLKSSSEWINTKLFYLASICLGIMAIPTFLDVMFRFTLDESLLGSIEIVEFLMVIVIFGSLGYVNDRGDHIRVDLVVARFPLWVQQALSITISFIGVVFFSVMGYCVFLTAMDRMYGQEESMMLGVPIYLFVLCATFGIGTFCYSMFADLITNMGKAISDRNIKSVVFGLCASFIAVFIPFILKNAEWTQNYFVFGVVVMAVLLTLLLLGMPIGLGMGVMGYLGLIVFYPSIGAANSMLGISPYSTGSSYIFTVIPMFILMGELAMYSGISKDLFNTANVWLGRQPGGLAIATTAGCAGFAAVSGDSMATAVTMASVALPEMKALKYDEGFACATLAAGGTLGILIPPSTGFIFYSLVTEVSIGKLFLAGIIPGLMLTGIFMGIIYFFAKRYPALAPKGKATTFKEKITSLKGVIMMLALILLILGGILTGFFSPNEGGAVGSVATFIYAVCRRKITKAQFFAALQSATKVTGGLLLILIGVGILSFFFAATSLPFAIADAITGMNANKYFVLILIIIFYLILGCLMNVLPMVLLTLPALFPTIIGLGFDPVWFGVIVVILMEAGQITPPVGINVFAISTVAVGVPMIDIFSKILPFFFGMLLLVFILTLFPNLVLWLPNIMF